MRQRRSPGALDLRSSLRGLIISLRSKLIRCSDFHRGACNALILSMQTRNCSTKPRRLNAALGLLQEPELLVAVDEKDGPGFKVDAAVCAAG